MKPSKVQHRTQLNEKALWICTIILFLIVSPFVGWLFGWLIGASQSPVVAAALPLLVTILTTLWLGSLKSSILEKNLSEKIDGLEDGDVKSSILTAIKTRQSLESSFVGLLFGLLFLTACWIGLQDGITERTGYRVTDAVNQIAQFDKLRDENKAKVINAYWRLRFAGITDHEDQELALRHLSRFVDEYLSAHNGSDEYVETGHPFAGLGPPYLENSIEPFVQRLIYRLTVARAGNELPAGAVPASVTKENGE